ncbi:uncharacterized protein PHACADRAFT_104048 [Phanerochaete carnosa HHB-10118-sp]|uniref:BTB domain-containing protein n=1 Tax=Phanerochaete carnosa (strain HHB-10118-sp) TaxID=650164 RepID=K5VI32_PHACS|nr:uncharacterized protein PHACADRAFT_104048 [Phanerochaete carnosa HHB-10118-sp]EKM50913.1 hypothetical protein PHACADRAFT_104048 [Phanerochaete carnosa HHB-10118-sp]
MADVSVASSPTPSPQTLEHPSLYFADGDIALSARESDMLTYIFRVHRLFLSHYAVGLRGMIAAATGGDAIEEYDCVPLVRMPEEDCAEDVARLIEVIYDISSLPRRLAAGRRADSPLLLSGLLDISDKYKIPGIVSVIKEHVRKEWPTTLAGWEIRQIELQSTATHDILPEPVSAIQFATAYDIPSILPAAFYHLAVLPTKRDWHDVPERPSLPAQSYPVANSHAARWFSLDDCNAVRFTKGRDAMLEYYFAHFADNMVPVTDAYGRRDTGCICKFESLQTEMQCAGVCQNLDCLQELKRLIERCDHAHGFCGRCVTRVRQNFAKLRADIWNRLP